MAAFPIDADYQQPANAKLPQAAERHRRPWVGAWGLFDHVVGAQPRCCPGSSAQAPWRGSEETEELDTGYGVCCTGADSNTCLSLRTVADKSEVSYACPGFYPIAAHNLMHAAFLFAIWKARRKFGTAGTCTRLDMLVESAEGAIFEADLIDPNRRPLREAFRFTVLVHWPGQ